MNWLFSKEIWPVVVKLTFFTLTLVTAPSVPGLACASVPPVMVMVPRPVGAWRFYVVREPELDTRGQSKSSDATLPVPVRPLGR